MTHTDFKTTDLISSIAENISDEELQMSILQGLIAAEISMKRQSMGLTQKQLADIIGVSQTSVSKWEAGETNFTLQTLVKISIKLGLSMQCPIIPSRHCSYQVECSNIYPFPSASNNWKSKSINSDHYHSIKPGNGKKDLKEM